MTKLLSDEENQVNYFSYVYAINSSLNGVSENEGKKVRENVERVKSWLK